MNDYNQSIICVIASVVSLLFTIIHEIRKRNRTKKRIKKRFLSAAEIRPTKIINDEFLDRVISASENCPVKCVVKNERKDTINFDGTEVPCETFEIEIVRDEQEELL